jgi:hypothetical protein
MILKKNKVGRLISYFLISKLTTSLRVLVAHACNSSYSGDRDQEDCGSKPSWAKSSVRLYLEKTLHKKGLVEWFKV